MIEIGNIRFRLAIQYPRSVVTSSPPGLARPAAHESLSYISVPRWIFLLTFVLDRPVKPGDDSGLVLDDQSKHAPGPCRFPLAMECSAQEFIVGAQIGRSASRIDAVMPTISPPIALLDRRQSPTALAVSRVTQRLLVMLGLSCVAELPLLSGRRADLVALGGDGEIWIVEIKSSIEDFRADQKWADYRMHCDRLFFATALT